MAKNAVGLAALLFLCIVLTPGCVSVETSKQMKGVARALERMPDAPVSDETQAQMSGWAAWAAYLLRVAGSF